MNAQPQGIGTTTDRVSVQWDFDGGPTRHRIGLIALDSDVVTEQDFHRMLPEGVMFYTTRVQTHHPLTVENLRKMGPKLAAATRLLTPERRLDVIAYSCTSGTVAIGDEAVTEQIRAGSRLDVPVITPITSALAGFELLRVDRISLLTPYIDSVNQAMRRFLEDHGITVLNIGSFCLEKDNMMAEIPPEAILQAAMETCCDEAQALFVSCTGIRAVEIIERAERALDKPVLSAIQTLFWQSLRTAGYRKPIDGFGSLLRR